MRTNVRTVVIVASPVVRASAVVAQYDATGAFSGYGPSKNTTGIFLGRTDLTQGDQYYITSVTPASVTVTPLPGGVVQVDSDQPGSFTWKLEAAAPTGATTGSKNFNQ